MLLCCIRAGMQVDEADKADTSTTAEAKTSGKQGDNDKDAPADGDKEKDAAKSQPEPSTHTLDNPARVVPAQEKLISFPSGSRFVPIRPGRTAGILLLKDSSPGKALHPEERLLRGLPITACDLTCL